MSVVKDPQGNIKKSTSKSFKVGQYYYAAEAKKIGVTESGLNKYNYNLIQYDNAKLENPKSIGFLNKNFNTLNYFPSVQNLFAVRDRQGFQKGLIDKQFKNAIKTLEITKTNIKIDNDVSTSIEKTIEREKIRTGTRQSYENLVYPTTLRRSDNDRLKISILPPLESESERKGNKGKAIGSVTLPPPGKITDNNKVDFKSGTLNPLELALAEAGLGLLLDDNPEALQNATKQFLDGTNDLKTVVSGLFVGKAINKSADAILSREAGAIINPNMQLLFNGPTLRPFNFNYKMSPRDRGESVQVQKIIRMFKQSSAVQRTETNFFLRSPNRYRLEFKTRGDSDHRFLPKIKTCSLLGFGVDYTPENSYMSYENSSMVSYNLTFAFQEIEPVFNDQYSQFDDLDIGF